MNVSNTFEYLATPFIEGIADENVAFNVIGLAYCSIVEEYYFLFVFSRKENDEKCTYYINTIKLYNLWKKRIDKTRLTAIQKKVLASIEKISDEKIDPIGT